MRRGRGAPGATDAVGAARTVNLPDRCHRAATGSGLPRRAAELIGRRRLAAKPTAVCVHVDGNGRRSAMWRVIPGHVDGNDHRPS